MLQVNTPRISARLIWALAEHIDLEGLDPLLADDPEDPLNIITSNMHKVLFNLNSSAMTTNRLQDVQAVLLSAQRLGSRNARAGQLLIKELEEFRNNSLADTVNKHQCRVILQRIKYATEHPDYRYNVYHHIQDNSPPLHNFLVLVYWIVLSVEGTIQGLKTQMETLICLWRAA